MSAMNFLFPKLFVVVFALVIGTILVFALRALMTWSNNNRQPVVAAHATVVAKRSQLRGGSGRAGEVSSMTSYFVTFQFESGDRLELPVPVSEFGYMVEGDRGTLSFQGTRYHAFTRDWSEA